MKQLVSKTLLVRVQIGTTNLGNDLALSIKAEHIVLVLTELLWMTGWLINNRNLFLTVLEAGKSRSRCLLPDLVSM